MQKQFDYGDAWNDAVALVSGNVQILIAVLGVFVVVPQFVLSMVMGAPPTDTSGDPNAALELVSNFYADNFLYILIGAIVSIIGTLTVLTVYLDNSRPTVGAAIAGAFSLVIPYFLANILVSFAVAIGLIFLIIPGIYLAIKFICAGPAIVAEKESNPIAAMRRSWELTKGNSLRIFGFVVILFIVLFVIAILFGLVSGIFLIGGPGGVMYAIGLLLQALFQGAVTAFSLAVTAAIYRQLSGPDSSNLQETFG